MTCGNCHNGYECADTNARFFVPDSGLPAQPKKCAWAARMNTNQRCQLTNVANMCPVTCGECDPNVQPYTFDTEGSIVWGKTLDGGIYGKYIDGGYSVFMLRMILGWISPKMLNVNLNEDSALLLSFKYRYYESSVFTNPCPNTTLYARLRLATGPYDWNGAVATTELVGPLTDEEQLYTKVFGINDDIVSKVKEGYAYYVELVIPGTVDEDDESMMKCVGTYAGVGFSVTTNFALYNWQIPTPAPTSLSTTSSPSTTPTATPTTAGYAAIETNEILQEIADEYCNSPSEWDDTKPNYVKYG